MHLCTYAPTHLLPAPAAVWPTSTSISMLRLAVTGKIRRGYEPQTAQISFRRLVDPRSGSGLDETARPWVGCSHWTGPYRPSRKYSTIPRPDQDTDAELTPSGTDHSSLAAEADKESVGWEDPRLGHIEEDDYGGASADSQDGITVEQVEPAVSRANIRSQGKLTVVQKLNRPPLPTSIKKLNRLLSHDRQIPIPASDLIERFVKGRGPGGQAINKTNSSVSLTHIPTGIRIQSQPTRSREENRKIARKILAEKLDLLRAHEAARMRKPESGEGAGAGAGDGGGLEGTEGTGQDAGAVGKVVKMTRKEKEKDMAGVWSRDEIRWEKERRRKVNKAKKTKKKRKESASEDGDEQSNTEGTG